MLIIDSYSHNDTKKIGKAIGELLRSGDIICLTGDLGAGKTAFSSGLALGMGIEEDIVSPTYTIVHEYQAHLPLYHFDVYRIEDVEEMYDLGYEDYFYGNGVTVIEWASLIEKIIPRENLWIDIKIGDSENHRRIYLDPKGARYQNLIEELNKNEGIGN